MFVSYQKKLDKKTLWERYVQGDKTAFGELYTYYHKSLTAFCMGRLRTIELAENAASETLIKLLQYSQPGDIENFESWLFTVAKNECNTLWATAERRRKLMEANYELDENQRAEVDVKYSVENIDELIRQTLDDTDFEIWQLYQQGYDNNEIAEMTNMNEKTVANRKSEARSRLKVVLRERLK
jgi:RNA polymerase sigma factor (sigma-70 family)